MLATAILLGCTVVLVELSNQGRRNSMAALEQATAQTICVTYLNEVLAGIRTAEDQEALPLEEYPGWLLSMKSEPLEQSGLQAIIITAEQESNSLGKVQSYSLTRWIAEQNEALPDHPDSSLGADTFSFSSNTGEAARGEQ